MKRFSTVLFVTYGGGHVNMIVPIVKRLQNLKWARCVTVGLTTAARVLSRNGIVNRGFSSLIGPGDALALARGEKLYKELNRNTGVSKKESVAYLGLSYEDLEKRIGRSRAARLYQFKGRQAFLPMGPMRRLFDEIQPDVVVSTISPRAEEAAIRVASERGIPSLCLVDFFGGSGIKNAGRPGYGSRVCVICEQARQWLLDRGRKRQEIVVTGNPAFDRLANPGWKEKGLKFRRATGWESQKIILWASQIEPRRDGKGVANLPHRIESNLIRMLSRHPDWRLIIRAHPNEPFRLPAHEKNTLVSQPGTPLDPVLAAADVVVIMTSTVGLEARLAGKPVISVDLSIFTDTAPFARVGLAVGIKKIERLESAIEKALRMPKTMPRGFAPPGSAAEKVVEEIFKLLNSKKSRKINKRFT